MLVQIPGGQIDRGRARELLKSDRLPRVQDGPRHGGPTEELLLGGLPGRLLAVNTATSSTRSSADSEARPSRPTAYLVSEARRDLTGKYLTDARVGFDRQQRPHGRLPVQRRGRSAIFGELTEANIGARLAIILDEPRLQRAGDPQSQITFRGQITGRFTTAGGGGPRGRAARRLALGSGRDRGGAHGRSGARARTRSRARPAGLLRRAASDRVLRRSATTGSPGSTRACRAGREPRAARRADVALRSDADPARASPVWC